MMAPPSFLQVLEALMFVSETPVTVNDVLLLLQRPEYEAFRSLNEADIRQAFEALLEQYAPNERFVEVRRINGGYQFFTKPTFGPYVRQALLNKEHKRLSRAALEVLAIIAYRQPVSKPEIEAIRGVSSDYAIHKLLEKQLIEPAGRSEGPGKPLLYRTSAYFFEYFSLNSLEDLPKLKELKLDEEAHPSLFLNPEQSQENVSSER